MEEIKTVRSEVVAAAIGELKSAFIDVTLHAQTAFKLAAYIESLEAAVLSANAGKDAKPTYTTGHCEHNKQPGGCQQHNLHCGWPKCDQKEINHA